MIKIKQAVIVEGKYDKIKLDNIIDAVIIKTDGFAIFKDNEKKEYIRRLAKQNGIIVMTDSDSAGAVIRSYLKGICENGQITNVYIPQLNGKEKRKAAFSKEGLLGVEGMSEDVILEALKQSGITDYKLNENVKKITKLDLYEAGFSGKENSASERKDFCKYLKLPTNLSANAFLDALNTVLGYEEFKKQVEKWRQD